VKSLTQTERAVQHLRHTCQFLLLDRTAFEMIRNEILISKVRL
jgi:hypothetical protein